MKNKNLLLGILALSLVITMTAVGCGEDPADDNGNGNGNGGSTDYWAKFKGTEWIGGDGTASNGSTSKLRIFFAENPSSKLKFLSFTSVADSDPQANGYAVIEVGANKFTCTQDNYTIDYALSSDGKTLTLSNIGKSNKKQYEGVFTKK